MLNVSAAYVIIALLLMAVGLINRDMVPGGTDYLFYLLIGILSVRTMVGNRRFAYPKGYIAILAVLLAVILFNSFISPYSPGLKYVGVATMVTAIPFCIFLLSYNIRFTKEEINAFIDRIIVVACAVAAFIYVENVLFNPPKLDSIIASKVIMIGFFASFCSQSIVLALARYHVTKRKRYIYAIIFLFLTILLLNQLKAIVGGVAAVVAYLFFMTSMKRVLKISILILGLAGFGAWTAVSGSMMVEKVVKYSEQLSDEDASEGIARIALYVQSVEIAKDFFPLGTGQGTFGSIPVNIIYSDVYYDYELSGIWGLAPNDRVNFKMDTHWASILGEMGVLGLIVYVILLLYPAIALRRLGRLKDSPPEAKALRFYVACGTAVLMLESFVLALPNRSVFIILYAGLSAVILRILYTSESLLEYEDTTGDN